MAAAAILKATVPGAPGFCEATVGRLKLDVMSCGTSPVFWDGGTLPALSPHPRPPPCTETGHLPTHHFA